MNRTNPRVILRNQFNNPTTARSPLPERKTSALPWLLRRLSAQVQLTSHKDAMRCDAIRFDSMRGASGIEKEIRRKERSCREGSRNRKRNEWRAAVPPFCQIDIVARYMTVQQPPCCWGAYGSSRLSTCSAVSSIPYHYPLSLGYY